MTTLWRQHIGIVALALTAIAAPGCHTAPAPTPDTSPAISDAAPDLDAQLAKAAVANEPVLVLVTEPGHGDPISAAKAVEDAALGVAETGMFGVAVIHLDLSVSRNRAAAARYHVTETPLLLGLTPHAVIVARSQGAISTDLVSKQVIDLLHHSTEIDATLAKLEVAITANPGDSAAQLALADFLRGHQNQREAIPHLAAVAHDASAEATLRVRAWVDLARAHRWVAEPEKGRHEANDLIATLGPTVPEARAGGSLMLGLQDAAGKRFSLARQEFQAAIDAAPASAYADEARAAIAALPKEGA